MSLCDILSCTLLLLALAVGCVAPRAAPPPVTDHLAAGAGAAAVRPNLTDILAQLIDSPRSPAAAGHRSVTSARNILVLSGGGKYGASSAGVLVVFGEALQVLLQAQTQNTLLRVFLLTRLTGGRFAVAAVPQDVPVNPDATHFDPEEMTRLFNASCEQAASGAAWRPTPPGVNPEEWPWPRTGTRFNTPSKQSVPMERVDSAH